MVGQYHSEDTLLAGGRTDATFQNISFEFKKLAYFDTPRGKNEALYGRDNRDHGLYDYLISNASISSVDDDETIVRKLTSGIGVAFDGKTFILPVIFLLHRKRKSTRLRYPSLFQILLI
jgi:hypothetical protein